MTPAFSIPVEVWLAAGYAVLLILTALGLERLGRWSAGANYPWSDTAWTCPTGEHVWPQTAEYTCRPLHLDRGEALSAPATGQPADTWPHIEVVRFHDVLALVLILLAGVIAGLSFVLRPATSDLVVLGPVLAFTGFAGWRRLRKLRTTRIEIPGVTQSWSRDEHRPG